MKKEYGDLGIPNLQALNICLMGSWIKRYSEGEGKLQRKVIHHKYNTDKPNIFNCSATTTSSRFWKGVMGVAKAVKIHFRWNMGNGAKVRFWEDTWFGTPPCYPALAPLHCL